MSDTTTAAVQELGSTGEIAFRRRGGLGEVELSRPKPLNALTLDMIRHYDPLLKSWARDADVRAVAIHGAGEKAFCAGGDVRAVWEAGRSGGDLTQVFFQAEYTLNRRIHNFPKPYVALIDGITMGGGVGLSVHGSHRVATERTVVAMPETAIGFFPDVGTTWVLPRLKGEIGMYMALTGARLKAADALYAGFATNYVPGERIEEVSQALAASGWGDDPRAVVDKVLHDLAGDPGPEPLAEQQDAIDRCFGHDSVEAILRALEVEGTDWARRTLETLRERSPTSIKVAFAALRRGGGMDFDDCMRMEFRLSQACLAAPDFYEGIRAVLIEKDNAPKWRPATLEQVDDALVESYFRAPPAGDLSFED